MARDQIYFKEFMQQFQRQLAAAGDYSIADWMRDHIPELAGPEITTFHPVCGAPGAMITVRGMHFSPVCEENMVLVGGKRAIVMFASRTELKVIAGHGISDGPVSVTVEGRTASGPVDYNVLDILYAGEGAFERTLGERRAMPGPGRFGRHPVEADMQDGENFDWKQLKHWVARRASDLGQRSL